MARILLLSVHWPARALVRAELEERGHDVIGLDDPEELAHHPAPDLLILDAAGLGLDAPALRALRARSGAPRAVLALSALDADRLAPARAAFDRTLVRPFTVGQVVAAAEEALGV